MQAQQAMLVHKNQPTLFAQCICMSIRVETLAGCVAASCSIRVCRYSMLMSLHIMIMIYRLMVHAGGNWQQRIYVGTHNL